MTTAPQPLGQPLLESRGTLRLSERQIPLPSTLPSLFPDNEISTCKYNCLTFIPKNLFEQFRKLANVYFLLIAILQVVPQTTVSNGVPNILMPLLFVVFVSAMKDLFEDLKRRKSDREENNRACLVWKQGKWMKTAWCKVMVGDIIKVLKNDYFCADLVLLSSSEAKGIAYIETKNLDGETNLKHKLSDKDLYAGFQDDMGLRPLTGSVRCEVPNNRIYQFNGMMTLEDQHFPLSNEQFLPRGTSLRNTGWALGLAVYTGHESKIMLNSARARAKASQLESSMNLQILYVFLLELALCLLSSVIYTIWFTQSQESTEQYLDLSVRITSIPAMLVVQFFTWMLIFTNLVPISLIVTLETVKFVQGWFISWDLELYYAPSDLPAEVHSSNLNEELGQVNYIFSDKTGTLTCNVMEFRKMSIRGQAYGTNEHVPAELKAPYVDFIDPKFMQQARSESSLQFLEFMATCHTIITEKGENDVIEYKAASPDELALVNAAKFFGVEFRGRTINGGVQLSVNGSAQTIQVHHIIEFDSDRKRMSVFISYGSGVRLLCKGADTVLLPRMKKGPYVDATWKHLEDFATEGLRTLVYAYRDFTHAEFRLIDDKFKSAISDIHNRDKRIAALGEELEQDLELLGASAIEDKLQDKVPETISSLRRAGIKVWVLTGDKVETAINIGFSCALLTTAMTRIEVTAAQTDKVKAALVAAEKMQEEKPTDKFALVVSGDSLLKIFAGGLSGQLVKIAQRCVVVLACRVSPQQKADIVKLIMTHDKNARTLAIGDGANDVNMITAAHVGVGLAGLEGGQAVRAADYAIGQFRFLRRLLFVHGRESYRKNCTVICYNFYKNMLVVFPLFCYGAFSAYSGQLMYNMWIYQLYNLIFSSMPIVIYAIFDREKDYSELEKDPKSFHIGLKNLHFGTAQFWKWLLEAALQGTSICLLYLFVICYYTGDPSNGKMDSLWVASNCIYGTVVLTVNLKVILFSYNHYVISVALVILSAGSYYFCAFMMTEVVPIVTLLDNFDYYGSSMRMVTNPNFFSALVVLLYAVFMFHPLVRHFMQLLDEIRIRHYGPKTVNDVEDEEEPLSDEEADHLEPLVPIDIGRHSEYFSRRRNCYADTGFAFSQEAGQTPQITSQDFYD